MPVFVTNATSPSPPPPPSPPPTTPREMKSVALALALALLDSARGQVCSTADVECVTAPRTYTCTWPVELAGEQPDDITCEQSSQEAGWGGCNTDSCGGESGGCCNSNRARSCTDDPSEECMMCMQFREDEVACLAPAVPEVAMCPEGTTLDADATTCSIGECVRRTGPFRSSLGSYAADACWALELWQKMTQTLSLTNFRPKIRTITATGITGPEISFGELFPRS